MFYMQQLLFLFFLSMSINNFLHLHSINWGSLFLCLYAAFQRIVWNAMQHSVRFKIFLLIIFPASVVCSCFPCCVSMQKWCFNIMWVEGNASDLFFPSTGNLQSTSTVTCKSQWHAALSLLLSVSVIWFYPTWESPEFIAFATME